MITNSTAGNCQFLSNWLVTQATQARPSFPKISKKLTLRLLKQYYMVNDIKLQKVATNSIRTYLTCVKKADVDDLKNV